MSTVKPGYKTTEGWLSLLALILSTLVALKWVPLTVSTTVQADAVKAIPLISGLYAIARGITKHGATPAPAPPVPVTILGSPALSGSYGGYTVSGTVATPPSAAPDPEPVEAPPVPPAAPPEAPAEVATPPADPITADALALIQS